MLCLLVFLLFATRPGGADDLLSPEARRAEIVRLVLEHGATRFSSPPAADAEAGAWLMLNSAGRPSYAEGSLEYAAALLTAGVEAERAARIVDTVLAAQARGGKCPGGFPWTPGSEPDAYATAYLAPWLVYIQQHLAGGLPEATRSRLVDALQPAAGAVQRFSARPDDERAFLTRTAAQAMLSAALDDPGGKSKAAADLGAWLKRVGVAGFASAGRPTAAAMAVSALNWVWIAEPSAEAKANAAAALEYLYRDLALRYQPEAGMVAGAVVDGHYGDYALGTGATRYLLYAQFGQPALAAAEPFAMFLAIPGFAPNDETVQLARTVDGIRVARAQSEGFTLTTCVTPRYGLATMTGPVSAGTMPVVLTYGPEGEPGAYCTVTPPPARVAAVQDGCRALVNFDVDNVGFEDERLFVVAEFHLGLRSDLDAVLVNQGRYTADFAAAVETRGSVVTERDGVYTAVIPVVMGPATVKSYDEPVGPAELGWRAVGDEQELVLKMSARSVRAREQARDNYRIGLAIEMATQAEYPTVDAFAAAIYDHRRVKQETKAKRVKVGQRTDNPHRPQLYSRPVERGDWIFETRIVQDMTFTGETPADEEGAPPKETYALELTDDLEQNQVVEQLVDGAELVWDFLYRSPALNHMPGDALTSVLRPPPAEAAPQPPADASPPAAP